MQSWSGLPEGAVAGLVYQKELLLVWSTRRSCCWSGLPEGAVAGLAYQKELLLVWSTRRNC